MSLFEGWLLKEGHIILSWKKRWFVIRGSTCCYYENQGDTKSKGAYVVTAVNDSSDSNIFTMETSTGKSFKLKAEDTATRQAAVEALRKAASNGRDVARTSVSQQPHDAAIHTQAFDAVTSAMSFVLPLSTPPTQPTSNPSLDLVGPINASVAAASELCRQGLLIEAIALLEQVTANHKSSSAWLQLGSAYLCRLDETSALAAFEKSVKYDPDNIDARVNLAVTCYLLGDFARAASNLQSIPKPESDVLNNLSLVHLELGNIPLAQQCLRDSIRLDPLHVKSLCNLGHIHMQLKEREVAIDLFERAVQADGNFAEAHACLGKALILDGSLIKASRHLRRALELDGTDLSVQLSLANALDEQGDVTEAQTMKQKLVILQANPRPEAALETKTDSSSSSSSSSPPSAEQANTVDRLTNIVTRVRGGSTTSGVRDNLISSTIGAIPASIANIRKGSIVTNATSVMSNMSSSVTSQASNIVGSIQGQINQVIRK